MSAKIKGIALFLAGVVVTSAVWAALLRERTWMRQVDVSPTQTIYVQFINKGLLDYLSGGGRIVVVVVNNGVRSEYPIPFHFENPYEARLTVEPAGDGYRIREDRSGTVLQVDHAMHVSIGART